MNDVMDRVFKLVLPTVRRLLPAAVYQMAWQWGEQETVIRRELLQKAKGRPNGRLLQEMVKRTHKLVLTFFNQDYAGIFLDEHISALSVRDFSQIYAAIMVLFCRRLGCAADLREDLGAITREPELVETMWKIVSEVKDGDTAEAKCIWDKCMEVVEADKAIARMLAGIFVILCERIAADLKRKWC